MEPDPYSLQQPLSDLIGSGGWRVILAGAERKRAVEALVTVLQTLPVADGRQPLGSSVGRLTQKDIRASGPSLSSGGPGIALAHMYVHRLGQMGVLSIRPDEHLQAARCSLEFAMATSQTTEVALSLFNGLCGVGWLCRHLETCFPNTTPSLDASALEAFILAELMATPWLHHYDLASGLIGIGIYATEGPLDVSRLKITDLVLDNLERLAHRTERGLTWAIPPWLPSAVHEPSSPGLRFDLGMAHGISGIVSFLAECYSIPPFARRVEPLLVGAVDWLLAQRLARPSGDRFPAAIDQGHAWIRSIPSWCYGDLGVGLALVRAGLLAGNTSWTEIGLESATIALAPRDRDVQAIGLCSGTAGFAHLANRLYHATDLPRLRELAAFWIRRTVDAVEKSEAILSSTEQADPGFGLLQGRAGVILALAAAIAPLQPTWDRVLLVNLPSSARVA